MNTKRLIELCDAVEAGAARLEDVAELVVLARTITSAHEALKLSVVYVLDLAPQGKPLQDALRRLRKDVA